MDAAQVRQSLNLTQEKFSALLGVSVKTLRSWEQGQRTPSGPSKALLNLIAADPEHAKRTLRGKE